LNDGNDWNDHIHMYDWGFNNFEMVTLANTGIVKGLDDDYYKDHVIVKHDFQYPLMSHEKKSIEIKIKLYSPKKDEWKRNGVPNPVGKMNFYLSGEKIGDRSLFYETLPTSSNISISVKKVWHKASFNHLFMHVLARMLGVEKNG
jgi:serine-type D-Ala-D-Ala carboxypeptidase (penicillin-binding protein 5/6)